MNIKVRPATRARFDDVATMLGPKNPESSVCWCLSHRLDSQTNRGLVGPARGEYVRKLCSGTVAPGVLAYEGDEVVGWAPRRTSIGAAPRTFPKDPPRRSVACLVGVVHPNSSRLPRQGDLARPTRRCRGLRAVTARAGGRGLSVDNEGKKVDLTMAYVGTRRLFERAGFTKASDTDAVSGGFARVVMRLNLH